METMVLAWWEQEHGLCKTAGCSAFTIERTADLAAQTMLREGIMEGHVVKVTPLKHYLILTIRRSNGNWAVEQAPEGTEFKAHR